MDLHSNLSADCPFTKDVAYNQPRDAPSISQSEDSYTDSKFMRRLASFRTWTARNQEAVSAMSCAFAGFEYCSNREQVWCEECGLIMTNLQAGVDMFIEHASNSPACPFVDRIKGSTYYKDAIDVKNAALSKARKPLLAITVPDLITTLKGE